MRIVTLTAIIVICAMVGALVFASDNLKIGSQYKIIQPMYLMAVYNDLDNRQLNKNSARAYLHATRYYEKSEVAFQYEVPAGTLVTILDRAPKIWRFPFFANRYFVRLEPDVSRGLDIVLELDRGIEGEMDGLNPELFVRP